MAPEQRRTSTDEEIDKILAELGIGSAPTLPSGGEKTAAAKPSAPRAAKERPAAAAPSEPKASGNDEFRIDLDVFDDIKSDEKAARLQKTAQSSRTPSKPKAAAPQKAAASQRAAAPQRKPQPVARPQKTVRKAPAADAGDVSLTALHHTSHLKEDLEKMAAPTGGTGQLTKQLRAGKKLEEITGPLQIQSQRRPAAHRPSERVQKAAAFAASVAAEPEQKRSIGKTIAGWVAALAIVAVILFLLFRFVIQIVGIQGGSMAPTLEAEDRVVISNLMYTPQQGDIVILSEDNVLKKQLVKRIIATEGQTVEIDAEGNVFVDGVELQETYLKTPTELGDVTYPVTVQQGQVFVMGDNRSESLDSRDSQIGLVDVEDIKGRILFRFYPFGSFGGVE